MSKIDFSIRELGKTFEKSGCDDNALNTEKITDKT